MSLRIRSTFIIALAVITGFFFTTCSGKNQDELDYKVMVEIPAGTFTMGAPQSEADSSSDERPQRQITLTGFYMSKYPVTQEWFKEVMSFNPSHFEGKYLPVETVTWFDALTFCNELSRKEGLEPVYSITGTRKNSDSNITAATVTVISWDNSGYRLPTEAQWEYACRAGTTGPFNTGDNITTDQANYDGDGPYGNNPKGIYRGTTTPVNMFEANPWGLHDMHGNVYELCWDRFERYPSGNRTDPYGTASGNNKVVRGGAYFSDGQYIRSASRGLRTTDGANNSFGFRIVLPLRSSE
ncbi:MAG: formylglycine-generating enzyme family protein [Treponema sp.]|nr:formylglycine-generating enzyme family protein [Treponema sp.]